MKTFIKRWILLFGFVALSASIIPPIFNGNWSGAIIIIELLITTFTIQLFIVLLEKLSIEPPLVSHFMNMCSVLAVVFIFGWIRGWYTPADYWIVFAMVVPVYVVIALLDGFKIKKDVENINQQIRRRELKRQMEKE